MIYIFFLILDLTIYLFHPAFLLPICSFDLFLMISGVCVCDNVELVGDVGGSSNDPDVEAFDLDNFVGFFGLPSYVE